MKTTERVLNRLIEKKEKTLERVREVDPNFESYETWKKSLKKLNEGLDVPNSLYTEINYLHFYTAHKESKRDTEVELYALKLAKDNLSKE